MAHPEGLVPVEKPLPKPGTAAAPLRAQTIAKRPAIRLDGMVPGNAESVEWCEQHRVIAAPSPSNEADAVKREEYPPAVAAAIAEAERLEAEAYVDAGIATRRALREGKPLPIYPAKNATAPSFVTPRAKGRLPASPYRSQLEADYAERLEVQRIAGEILAWSHEGMRFALGGGAWYKPDFQIVERDFGLTIAETKGPFAREASVVRIKAAAGRFPYLRFVMVRRSKADEWTEEEIKP